MKSALIALSTLVITAGLSLAASAYPLKTCLVTGNELFAQHQFVQTSGR